MSVLVERRGEGTIAGAVVVASVSTRPAKSSGAVDSHTDAGTHSSLVTVSRDSTLPSSWSSSCCWCCCVVTK